MICRQIGPSDPSDKSSDAAKKAVSKVAISEVEEEASLTDVSSGVRLRDLARRVGLHVRLILLPEINADILQEIPTSCPRWWRGTWTSWTTASTIVMTASIYIFFVVKGSASFDLNQTCTVLARKIEDTKDADEKETLAVLKDAVRAFMPPCIMIHLCSFTTGDGPDAEDPQGSGGKLLLSLRDICNYL